MNKDEKFYNFIKSIKNDENASLLECFEKAYKVCFENDERNIPTGKFRVSDLTLEQKESLGVEAYRLVNEHNKRIEAFNKDTQRIYYIELSGWGKIRYTLWLFQKNIGLTYVQTLSEDPLRAVKDVIQKSGDSILIRFVNEVSRKGGRIETATGVMPFGKYKRMPWKDVLYQDFIHIYSFIKRGKRHSTITIQNLANEIENSTEYQTELAKPENKEKITAHEERLRKKKAEVDVLVELFKSKNYNLDEPEFAEKLSEFSHKYNMGMPKRIFNLNLLSSMPIGKYIHQKWRDLLNTDFGYIQWFLKEGRFFSKLADDVANEILNSPEYVEKINPQGETIDIRRGNEVTSNATYEGKSANGNLKFMVSGTRLIVKPSQLPLDFNSSQLNANDNVNVNGIVSWVSNDGNAFMMRNIKLS